MKLNNLQVLRGIAALLVVFFHFKEYLNFPTFKLGNLLFQEGSIGVPVFFVISGFIMVYTTSRLNSELVFQNISTFIKKRIVRIVPLYYVLTFAWIFLGGSVMIYFSEHLSRLVHSLLFLPFGSAPPVLFLGWSLNYEMFFYLIFAFAMVFKKYRYHLFIAFFGICILLGFLYDFHHPYLKMVTSRLNLFFLIGVILGLVIHKINLKKTTAWAISIIGILLFATGYFKWLPIESFIFTSIWVSGFVIAFLLFDKILEIRPNQFFIHIGNISYSIYLAHPFVEILMRKFKPILGTSYQPILFIVGIALVLLISTILYEIFEKRFTNYLRKIWIKD